MSDDEPLGRCGRVLDEKKDLVCAREAVVEVLVRSAFSLMVARLCGPCEIEHREFYRTHDRRQRRSRNFTGGHSATLTKE